MDNDNPLTIPRSSLFVGRFQPFHAGHKALIETVLKKGKPVVIAIRDTEISHKNPYTVYERWTKIQEALKKYGSLVKIVIIPDIDEICYGRDVGYAIRNISLDKRIEKISGTKERQKSSPTHPIIWLTGQSGSGKTTIAQGLKPIFSAVVLDGDELRQSISKELGFSQEDRHTHNLRVARLAQVLARQSLVIVSVIAPFKATRKQIDILIKPIWIYVKRTLSKDKNKPYEIPTKSQFMVDSDIQNSSEQIKAITVFLQKHSSLKKR